MRTSECRCVVMPVLCAGDAAGDPSDLPGDQAHPPEEQSCDFGHAMIRRARPPHPLPLGWPNSPSRLPLRRGAARHATGYKWTRPSGSKAPWPEESADSTGRLGSARTRIGVCTLEGPHRIAWLRRRHQPGRRMLIRPGSPACGALRTGASGSSIRPSGILRGLWFPSGLNGRTPLGIFLPNRWRSVH
jgi:hypothetical protein